MPKNNVKSLRKENNDLRKEVKSLVQHVKQLESEIVDQQTKNDHLSSSISSSDRAKTVEYLSDQLCDDMVDLHDKTLKELKKISYRLENITSRCDEIKTFIDNAEYYSYQFNLKIVGMPTLSNESADDSTGLCLRLFKLIGAKDITIQDIDIAHRVPQRNATNRPNAIICRFTRRLVRNKVLACRKSDSDITAEQLGFDPRISVKDLVIFEHLSPRQQSLLFETKKFKMAHSFKFCWTKGGTVFLWKQNIQRFSR